MKRISIFLRDDQIKSLNDMADFKKVPYSELVREAIDYKMLTEFGKLSTQDILENTCGILKDRFKEYVKSEEIVNDLRADWKKELKEIKNSRIILDSDIIIDHLRGFKYLDNLMGNSSGNTSLISAISIAEIYSLIYFNEIERVEKLISTFKAVNIDSVIAKLAGKYRMIFYKSHNLLMPDSLIAASAKISNAILVTKNIKHFPMTDIDIIKPY